MTVLPHYLSDREYESTLHEIRVSKGLTIKELANLAGVSKNAISSLANGMLSPVFEKRGLEGQVRTAAHKIAKALGVCLEDLFPRYFCRLGEGELTEDQYPGLMIAAPPDGFESFERHEIVEHLFRRLNWREEFVVQARFFEDLTLNETGKRLGVRQERVRQVEAKAIRKMKKAAKELQEEFV